MARVFKRTWDGVVKVNGVRKIVPKSAWVVDYKDPGGKRRFETFEKKRDADARLDQIKGEVRDGTHVADADSKGLADAADAWVAEAEADGLERGTTVYYASHVNFHIKPFLGAVRLSRLTLPQVQQFKRDLRAAGRSQVLVDKVVGTLGAILAFAMENGLVAKNVVRSARSRRRRGQEARAKTQIAIPTKDEIRAMLAKVQGRWRPLIVCAIFTGLRGSELRALSWSDVDLKAKVLTVNRRADGWGQIGAPKTKAGARSIPLTPMAVNALREWRVACPRSDLDLVFPSARGRVERHWRIVSLGFEPLQIECGIVDDQGRPKYGLHALRHAAASLFIDQGMNAKRVQTIMGHAGISVTFDVYGKLFPAPEDDQRQVEQMQARLLGPGTT